MSKPKKCQCRFCKLVVTYKTLKNSLDEIQNILCEDYKFNYCENCENEYSMCQRCSSINRNNNCVKNKKCYIQIFVCNNWFSKLVSSRIEYAGTHISPHQ